MRRLWLVALLVAALPSCRSRAPLPSIVLVSLDTVRADHLSLYGYPVRTSPRLEELARRATVYDRAQAAGAWTVPGHASMFTGRHVFEHGAHTLPPHPKKEEAIRPLDDAHVTLAESLAELGYQNAAVVANAGYLAPRWGLSQGFPHWQVHREPSGGVTEQALIWVDEKRAADKPFFLFVNYMDAHRPYHAATRPGLLPRPVTDDGGQLVQRLYGEAMPGDRPVDPQLLQQVNDQYDTALANLDEGVHKLLAGLQQRGLLEDALVIVTSDHGEFLGEHHLVEHSKDVYQEVIGIPLVVKQPRQSEGTRDARLVSHVDLPRLVLSALPREAASKVEARYPYTIGSHPVIAENYYARLKDLYGHPWSPRLHRVRTALFEWPMKLIHSSDGRHELYDLARDPREQHDLAAERPALVASMVRGLEGFQKTRRYTGSAPAATPKLTPEEIEELRTLGYVGP